MKPLHAARADGTAPAAPANQSDTLSVAAGRKRRNLHAPAPRAADPWRTNGRLTGNETGFRDIDGGWIRWQDLQREQNFGRAGIDGPARDGEAPRRWRSLNTCEHQAREAGLHIVSDGARPPKTRPNQRRQHGTNSSYQLGCLCAACRGARAAYQRAYRSRKRNGGSC
jgi:hypothetical protein